MIILPEGASKEQCRMLNMQEGKKNMPPKIRITKENIIDKAVKIIREQGIESLNARSLAGELGCSVQPIFRAFSSMGELKETVFQYVAEYYQQFLRDSISEKDGLVGLEMTYIRFAREEKNFFRWLHMSDRLGLAETKEFTSVGINREIIEAMAKMTGLSIEKANELYVGTFFAAHGIAVMLATNHCTFQDEEIKGIIENVFNGMVMKLRKEDK